MRKIISVSLAIVMIFSAMFCVSASNSKSIEFLEKLEKGRAISIEYKEDYGFLEVYSSTHSAKFIKNDDNEFEYDIISATDAGFGPVKMIKERGNPENTSIYVSFFKIRYEDLGFEEPGPANNAFSFWPLVKMIDSGVLRFLKFDCETEGISYEFGDVNYEYLSPDYDKIVKELPLEKQTELEGKTKEEIIEAMDEFAESDDPKLKFLAKLTHSYADFCYKNGNLVALFVMVPDETTGEMNIFDYTAHNGIITSDVPDETFEEPKLLINLKYSVRACYYFFNTIFSIIDFFRGFFR